MIDGWLGEDAPPFTEAVEAFLAKEIMPRWEFEQLAASLRQKVFTAAYVYAADQLQRVYEATLAAIEQGTTLPEFKQAVGDILAKPWHRETVFRTNVLSAYGKGHYDQAQASRAVRPYGRYSAVMDGRTRPSHARLHGLVYPLDHPFWQQYWPPWGYNCRCGVTTLSSLEVEEAGLPVQDGLEGLPAPEGAFVSPARGDWQPDLSRYVPALREMVEKAIYD